MAFLLDGEVHQIIEFQHVKPGKGGAFVRTKLRRLKTGGTIEKTFRSGEKVTDVFLEKRPYQFLYRQASDLVLMDTDSFEQITISEKDLGDGAKYLIEEMIVTALIAGDEVMGYEIPNFVELKVVETDPAFKGDTVGGGATKPATLESGAVVQVPFHIKEGETLKIDTRTGDYLERVKN